MRFVCPLSGTPLCPGGDAREVTVHVLPEYVRLVAQLWLADGVKRQVLSCRHLWIPLGARQPSIVTRKAAQLTGVHRGTGRGGGYGSRGEHIRLNRL